MGEFIQAEKRLEKFWYDIWNIAAPSSNPNWRILRTISITPAGGTWGRKDRRYLHRLNLRGHVKKLGKLIWAIGRPHELVVLTEREERVFSTLWEAGIDVPGSPSTRFVPDGKRYRREYRITDRDIGHLVARGRLEKVPRTLRLLDGGDLGMFYRSTFFRRTLALFQANAIQNDRGELLIVDPLRLFSPTERVEWTRVPNHHIRKLAEARCLEEVPFTGGILLRKPGLEPKEVEALQSEAEESNEEFMQRERTKRGLKYDRKPPKPNLDAWEPVIIRGPHNTRNRGKS